MTSSLPRNSKLEYSPPCCEYGARGVALMLSAGEAAEIIQHTHCCDSSELPDFYIFSHSGIFTFLIASNSKVA